MNHNKSTHLDNTPVHVYNISLAAPQSPSFKAASNASVLASMEKNGQHLIPIGCRGGGCGQCRIHILEGQYFSKPMSRAWITPEQKEAGIVLACRVFPRENLLIEVDTPKTNTAYGLKTIGNTETEGC